MKTHKSNSNQNQELPTYKFGQELIWDSGAGFDVVTYKNKSNLFEGKMLECCMKTGIKKGRVIPIDSKELNVFTLKRWADMRKRYDAC